MRYLEVLNNLFPNLFSQSTLKMQIIHSHNTRQSHGLHVINPTNKFGQHRIIYQGTFLGTQFQHNFDHFT